VTGGERGRLGKGVYQVTVCLARGEHGRAWGAIPGGKPDDITYINYKRNVVGS